MLAKYPGITLVGGVAMAFAIWFGAVTFERIGLFLVSKLPLPGRNRIVRRTMDAVGHPVRKLSRTAIGPVRLGRLKSGELRELTREELGGLLDLTERAGGASGIQR